MSVASDLAMRVFSVVLVLSVLVSMSWASHGKKPWQVHLAIANGNDTTAFTVTWNTDGSLHVI